MIYNEDIKVTNEQITELVFNYLHMLQDGIIKFKIKKGLFVTKCINKLIKEDSNYIKCYSLILKKIKDIIFWNEFQKIIYVDYDSYICLYEYKDYNFEIEITEDFSNCEINDTLSPIEDDLFSFVRDMYDKNDYIIIGFASKYKTKIEDYEISKSENLSKNDVLEYINKRKTLKPYGYIRIFSNRWEYYLDENDYLYEYIFNVEDGINEFRLLHIYPTRKTSIM